MVTEGNWLAKTMNVPIGKSAVLIVLVVMVLGWTIHFPSPCQADKQVMHVQKELARRGYNPGPADGHWGALTAAAVRQFQTDEGLTVSGELDEATIAALGLEDTADQQMDDSDYLIPFSNIGWAEPITSAEFVAHNKMGSGGDVVSGDGTGSIRVRPSDITILKSGESPADYAISLEPRNLSMPSVGGICMFTSRGENLLRHAGTGIVLVVGDTLNVGQLKWAGQLITSGVVVVRDEGLELIHFE